MTGEMAFLPERSPINYSLVCVLWIVPLMALVVLDLIPNGACLVLCGLGALIGPILLYRYSQCIWLALYYSLVVDELQSAPESTTPSAHPASSNAVASAENGADTALNVLPSAKQTRCR